MSQHGEPEGLTDTVSLTEHITTRRRSRAARWWIVAGVAAALIAVALIGWFSPVLALQSVTVTGTQLSDPAAIKANVLERYRGEPLPQIRLGDLERSLESENPKAKSIDITWGGPRSLHVTVTDREPRVAWKSTGGWIRYDSDGRELDTVTRDPGLPVLTGSAHGDDSIRTAVAVLDACGDSQRARIEEISAGNTSQISLGYRTAGSESGDGTGTATTPEGNPAQRSSRKVTVLLGDAGDAGLKLKIADRLAQTGANTIDVSVPTRPVTR